MNKTLSSLILIAIGVIAGIYLQPLTNNFFTVQQTNQSADSSKGKTKEQKIDYWVAPMDANFRRDKPGKSPMGMDLVPVYKEDNIEQGVVKISPIVENNLGVRLAKVTKGHLDKKINTVGYVSFDEEKIYHLHTRVEGWVENLLVRATGDVVKKDQKLFGLYSPILVNAQEEYLSALKNNNKILINASKERLLALGIESDQIKQLKQSRQVKQNIAYFAKHDGFIEKLNIREGMFVKPSIDVLTIGQLDTVWVIAEVFESQSAWVKKGQKVEMSVASYPDTIWQGEVDYIYPILNINTRTLQVRIRFNNQDDKLKPNMFARLTIHNLLDKESLLIKREALIRSGKIQRVVKSLGDGKFVSVAVKIGDESSHYIEILEGLKENDVIVTSAQFLIDSESNLSASFARMEESADNNKPQQHQQEMHMKMNMSKAIDNPNQAWLDGEVVDVMHEDYMLTIEHKAVKQWGWPDMLMDFKLNKSIDINDISIKQKMHFLVEKHPDNSIEIIKVEHGAM